MTLSAPFPTARDSVAIPAPAGLSPTEDALGREEPDLLDAYWRRANHENWRVRGDKEKATTTTPLDVIMMNDRDRFRLAMDAIDRVPTLGSSAVVLRPQMSDAQPPAPADSRENGEDHPVSAEYARPASEGRNP